jgi:hypothetical protein
MTSFTIRSLRTLTAAALAALAIAGCEKDNGADPLDTAIPDNIFPLTAGRVIMYNGYLTQNDTETKITASEAGYSTSWTITTKIPVTAVFPNPPFNVSGNAYLVRDTTRVPGVGVTMKFTPVFADYDSATGAYRYMTNLGYFFRTFQVKAAGSANIASDSLRFIVLANPRAGMGGTFTCFDETFAGSVAGSATNVNLKITGTWGTAKQAVTTATATYDAYYLEIRRVVTIGTTPVATGLTAKIWLVAGVGPVKMHLLGDAESHGNYRVITGKNF